MLDSKMIEFAKCAKNPIYYLNNYGYVFDAKKKKVDKMTCFGYQETCVQKFHKDQNSIILKSRQCLPGDTYVDTPGGPKAIKDFKIGDEVYSYNLLSNEVEIDTIYDAWCSGDRQCLKIFFDNTEAVESGENHPFYDINKKNWVACSDLRIGDEILNTNKKKSVIKNIEKTLVKKCYDISVTKNENFLINGLLVHNTGLSVVTAGYVAWRLMFRYDEKILIIANDGAGAVRFLDSVKQFIEYTPDWMKPDSIETENQKKIMFSNNSYAEAKASSPNAGRGDSLTMLILDETAFIKDAEAIWMGAGMALSATGGKCIMISCVPRGTMVFTDIGIKKIDDFIIESKIGGYEVDDYNVFGKDKLRSGNLFFNNGLHKTKKIISTNAQIEGTFNHKLWACKNGVYDWYKMEDLEVGDFIAVQYGMESWGHNDDLLDFKPSDSNKMSNKFNPKKIDKNLAYLIGLYISEGSVYKKFNKEGVFIGGSVTITCGDDISKSIESLGLSYSCHDDLHYSIGSKNLIELFEFLGFDLSKKAKEKEIPSRLLEMSRENIIYMLRGIFDGDGYSRKDKGYIGISMNSEVLINQIRMLLLNFGILTDYYEVWTKKTKKVNVETLNYRISANAEFSKVFYEKIGFNFERKQNNKLILEEKYNLQLGSKNDIIPFSKDLINRIVKESGFSTYFFKKNKISSDILLNSKKDYTIKNITRKTFFKIFELCKDKVTKETIQEVERILSPNLKWNKINKIDIGEKETFDFSLPNNDEDFWAHSVIYNGVLGHQTPNGTSGLYYKTWVDAINLENNFNGTTVHWTENPNSTVGLEWKNSPSGEKVPWSPWYEDQCKRLNWDSVKIAQELDLSFEGSKRLAIDPQLVEKYRKKVDLDNKVVGYIRFNYLEKENLNSDKFAEYTKEITNTFIFKTPEEGRQYILAADVARGDGKDYSTIQVLDVDTLEQVAEYREKISPDLFPFVINYIGKMYNMAYTVIEANSFGLGVCFDMRDKFKYPRNRLYFSKNIKDIHVRHHNYKVNEGTEIPGFQTSRKNRVLLIKSIIEHMRENSLILHSKRLMAEFQTFVMNGDKPEHEPGFNDDLILALGLALYIRDTEFENVTASTEMYKSMLQAMMLNNSSSVGKIPNPNSKKINIPNGSGGLFIFNGDNINTGEGGDMDDLNWLLS